MGWSTPHTFTVSEATTAATLNASVSSDTNFLHDPPGASITMTTLAPGMNPNSTTTPVAILNSSTDFTILWDTDTMTSALPAFTVNTAGVYLVSLNGQWGASATGAIRRAAIAWNSANHCCQECEAGSNVTAEQTVTAMINAAAADTFQPFLAENSGAGLAFSPCTNDGTHEMLTATWISAG